MENTSNKARETRGRPFAPGNKHGQGRPAGSRNKATLALEALIDGQGEEVVSTIITEAKNGNMAAAKALLDRLVPPRKSTPRTIDTPPVNAACDLEAVLLKVTNDMVNGEIAPDEAAAITSVVASQIKLLETLKLDERIAKLEAVIGNAESA